MFFLRPYFQHLCEQGYTDSCTQLSENITSEKIGADRKDRNLNEFSGRIINKFAKPLLKNLIL